MNIYTATLIVQKHLNWQNDKRNLPKVNEEKLKEATELLTDLVKKLTIPVVVRPEILDNYESGCVKNEQKKETTVCDNQFYCSSVKSGGDRCETQCLGCAGLQELKEQ